MNLQLSAATEVAVRSCRYLCPFPLAFDSGSFTSDYLQAGVALLVLASVSVGVGVRVYSGSADKTTYICPIPSNANYIQQMSNITRDSNNPFITPKTFVSQLNSILSLKMFTKSITFYI